MLGVSGMPVLDAMGKLGDLGDRLGDKGFIDCYLIPTVCCLIWMAIDAISISCSCCLPITVYI